MRTENLFARLGVPLIAATALALASCATTNKPGGTITQEVSAVETPEGAIVCETTTGTATVTAVDQATRHVTLLNAAGQKISYKVGPQAVNFPQIQVGDQVKVTLTEEVAVYLGRGAPPSAAAGTTVAIAPVVSRLSMSHPFCAC